MEKKKSIYKAAIGVVIIEIVMKIIAFVKQSILAYYFGATEQTDIYFVANDFICHFSQIIIEAAKVAIMGIYANILVKESKEQGDRIISKFFLLFLPLSFLFVISIIIFSPLLATILAPSFSLAQSALLQKYIIILSGIFVFAVCVMIFESILNTNEFFIVSKLRSLIYSICVIAVCFFAYREGVKVLILAQYLSFVFYLIIQFIATRKIFKFRFSNPFKNPYLVKVLKLMGPLMIGNSVVRINYLIDKAVATSIGPGGVSALAYCQMLDQFVVVVIISSISFVMFAHFANLVAKNEQNKITHVLDNSLGSLCLMLIPTAVVVLIESKNIVGFVYGHGNFNDDMVLLTSIALQGYAIRYFFVGIRDIITQSLYAYKEVKRPMINSIIATIINIIISVGFVKKLGILSIALGTSASAFVGMILNVNTFKKVNPDYKFTVVKNIMVKSVPAIIICLLMSLLVSKLSFINGFFELVIVSVFVFLFYFFVMYISKSQELISISKVFITRFKKILHK